MSIVRNTQTGTNFLKKEKTGADLAKFAAVQMFEKQYGINGSALNTIFTLSSSYVPESKTLMIFINGIKCINNPSGTTKYDYIESGIRLVTFKNSLLDDDVVEFIIAGSYTIDLNTVDLDMNLRLTDSPDNLSYSGYIVYKNIAGVNASFGTAFYLDSLNQLYEANATDNTKAPCVHLSLETGDGNKLCLVKGYIRNDSWLFDTTKRYIYLSKTDGELTQDETIFDTTGNIVQVVGYPVTSTVIYFDPKFDTLEVK